MASSPSRRRPALILFVVIATGACLALGWWQWMRFEEAGGTGQNLGYAFQWPLFAGFVVYAYRKFVQLEDHDAPIEAADAGPREIPADVLPTRASLSVAASVGTNADDPEVEAMAAYNNYLAQIRAEGDRSTK
ncbi:transcriptional regulator [Rhodococcus kronopolitis]|uniref:Transcriptional regulator n=1 Tax=Rhodococcus kronopolitis TaxID=1460226 RepID=A0ABV9FMM0_9NOCA